MENTATAVKNKIEVKNLNFYYGKFHAIRNVNMSIQEKKVCLLYTSPSPRDKRQSRMPSSA